MCLQQAGRDCRCAGTYSYLGLARTLGQHAAAPPSTTCVLTAVRQACARPSLAALLCARQEIVAACNGIAECDLFVYFPLGKSLGNQPGWPTSAFLKTARNPANISQLKCASVSV